MKEDERRGERESTWKLEVRSFFPFCSCQDHPPNEARPVKHQVSVTPDRTEAPRIVKMKMKMKKMKMKW